MKSQRASLLLLVVLLTASCKKELPPEEMLRSKLSHRSLGLAYLEENRLSESESEFKKLIEVDPKEALGSANLALTYLRLGRNEEAEREARKALELSREPGIVLILAEILDRTGRREQAVRELENSVQDFPRHVTSLYKLAQMHLRSESPARYQRTAELLRMILEASPGNLPARLQLIESWIRTNKPGEAMVELRLVRQIIIDLPEGSELYFNRALDALNASNTNEGLPAAIAFHNFVKPTPLYQAGIMEAVGPGGPLLGFPVVHFTNKISTQLQSRPLEYLRFAEASVAIPGGAGIVFGDFDQDNDPDAFVPGPGNLLRNDKGKLAPVDFPAPVNTVSAAFVDYNNDGRVDLCTMDGKSLELFENHKGSFKSIFRHEGKFLGALVIDIDQDGDLDFYTAGEARVLRNNADGTFSDITSTTGLSATPETTGALFADFDDDGDLDLLVVAPNSAVRLYSNLRQARFEDRTASAGLDAISGDAAATADYDADGFADLVITGKQTQMLRNRGHGRFEKDVRSASVGQASGTHAIFLDFDNDGYQDLLIGGPKVRLFRNDGSGVFQDATAALPESARNSRYSAVTDYDSDGDLDVAVVDANNAIRVFRNDGGNANRWMKVALNGLTTGSGKNNWNGIGAKVEVKAGVLYQMRYVTESVSHFGLGQRTAADVVRVVWTNGVPQNHVQPQTNQLLVEKQVLKGSCPFVYAWNGSEYEFVTDIMWKSALGMPLGIMGGSTAYAFPNSSDEYVKIPGSKLKSKDGFYSIQLTEELWETAFLDQSRLVAVDHPENVEIFIDEKFIVPPFPKLRVFPVSRRIYPVSAVDQSGINVLNQILRKDDVYISNLRPSKYQGMTELHDLVLDLGEFQNRDEIVLFLHGWIFPGDASINVAIAQPKNLQHLPPSLEVLDRSGNWKTAIPFLSFPMGKDKTMVADLTGKFESRDHRIRIRTTMEIYWDEIFYTRNEGPLSPRLTTLMPVSADLHYRGFSRMYRKNLLGPHWFDYQNVDASVQWRDLEGEYTRFGDVTPLLMESDDQFVILNAGDEITIRFDASQAPSIPAGWVRDFLLYSDGWVKDGDFNTAHSKTVGPLPSHGLKSYPYSQTDRYPDDEQHRNYQSSYNTRKVKPVVKIQ